MIQLIQSSIFNQMKSPLKHTKQTLSKSSILITPGIRTFTAFSSFKQSIKLGEDAPTYHVPNSKHQYDPIKYRTHGTLFYTKTLPGNFRLANEPLYQNPLINFVVGAKRFSFAFGVIGLCFSYLMMRTELILPEFCTLMSMVSVVPYPLVTYLYSPYVFKIIRVYDTTKPQTLENLIKDEQLIIQKLNWSGFKVYSELIRVDSLYVPEKDDYKSRLGFINLISEDPDTGLFKNYYINDSFGSIKMDRIWALAERKSGIDNGRGFFKI